MTRIAIVGMACRYPDASSPTELWENAVAGRRAFRRLPDARMRLDDYWSADPAAPDRFYARNAAVLQDWEFDRVAFKVAGSTYRSTDLTHWLALEVAAAALADAGFPMGAGLPTERTGVVVGNSLTGEFARANQLRLRWPFVRRVLAPALSKLDWDEERMRDFLDLVEADYKRPFPPIDEDTLAGALSNTIAGRICNHFDLRGGGYTVDGACSSSLLSVTTACRALVDGDVDVMVTGGVDLSIDPFEIIGFARTGALATGEMRVYDRGSNGFWPGEGCGMVVLMREPDARRAGHRIYATVAGWGVSSDGRGGITRPEIGGYQLALRRAYARAGFGLETVALFEGHGTGTKVGDSTELSALSQARRMADPDAPPAVISSIKAMIGHTKAAAGVAGLIKAVLALHHQVLPPALGCPEPHELLTGAERTLRVLPAAEPWPTGAPLRAGVTAMGFGGINTHVVVESTRARRPGGLDPRTATLTTGAQDAELLVLDGMSWTALRDRAEQLAAFAGAATYAQLADLAVTLRHELRDLPYRAAVVVVNPEDAERRLRRLVDAVNRGEESLAHGAEPVFLGQVTGRARIGYLFPGQGSGRGTAGGALRRRFPSVDAVYRQAALPDDADPVATQVAQPRIVTGSVAGLAALTLLGIEATVAVGHSLGELTALHWAGVMDEAELLRMATARGAAMARHSASGTMAGIAAAPAIVERLIDGLPVVVSGYNGPAQTVVAGAVAAVREACRRAAADGIGATPLAVSHAFHSPLVAPAAEVFAGTLVGAELAPVGRRVVSTVTGEPLPAGTDVPSLLRRQITEPVRFSQAVAVASGEVDLFVEVGPGRVLSRLAAEATGAPAVPLDTDDESLVSLLRVVGAAYVGGAAGMPAALFEDRLARPIDVTVPPAVLASPCEAVPVAAVAGGEGAALGPATPPARTTWPAESADRSGPGALDLLRQMAASRAELPVEMVRPESRLLDDLHLSSITVGNLVNEVAERMGMGAVSMPLNFAAASVRELAAALEELQATGGETAVAASPPVVGAESWARAWAVDLDPAPVPEPVDPLGPGGWRLYAPADHPFAAALADRLAATDTGSGVLVCLPPGCTESDLERALHGAQDVLAGTDVDRFVLVQHDRGAAGLAKTLRMEQPRVRVTIAHVPATAEAIEYVVGEVRATDQYVEAYYDLDGTRRVPTLRAMPLQPEQTRAPLDESDVLLVTGGGKGITAECAFALAVETGARLALLGRSDPATDSELAANLERLAHHGVTAHYVRADVTDPEQVAAAVDETVREFGPVTAVLHGAGTNEPAALGRLDAAALRRAFAAKVGGLRAVLDVVGAGNLRLLVTLGSIIGRAGLQGEAHYATANEWLADLTRTVGEEHPSCRSVCLEWSVWSGVGMGERLSVVDTLAREGVTPITPTQGVELLRRLVTDPAVPPVVVVSGRTSGIDTVRYERVELPLLRFLERPLVHYPGVELVTEAELSTGSDPYLSDHHLDGNLLFPAVLGMEAMAQVASALTGRSSAPTVEDAEFLRPIVIAPQGATRIRVAAVVTAPDVVQVVIHSSETRFAAEHFRARLRYGTPVVPDGPPRPVPVDVPEVPLRPATELYGDLLFQGRRFQRVLRYHHAAARDVDADLLFEEHDWFAAFHPRTLLLGDPGIRDALMHGNQVCVPNATLLPTGVARIWTAAGVSGPGPYRYQAVERSRDRDTYVYDVVLRTGDGDVVERWEGLSLRAVRRGDGRGPWLAPLLGPFLQRAVGELTGVEIAVGVEPDGADAGDTGDPVATRRSRSARALARATGRRWPVRYRGDGRPEIDGGQEVSFAHGAGLTVCAVASQPTACDVEAVVPRTPVEWRGLLGAHAELLPLLTGPDGGDNRDVAGTRVWVAMECLQKAGEPLAGPLTVRPVEHPGWVVLSAGPITVATFVTALRDVPEPVVFGLLTGEG
ncbi:enediyne polyketide synthase [Micromonospora phaseoli]|uniref:Enediyne polyketide synthase n=1 Tax=Micromonospora phaseoli TaxID=1144548 RepID=A0A1H7BXE6_9ACTN|nr:type I polyketide synthase [Micromonospora phaseoli]PZV92797.1 enediyne polyketide synthase [Micromonospora phaseoli]GIJ76546.1 polyketide synthase [Micromonospora phaseoli]SEJ81684.1 enediyne polyketide synthase [Micromonospora phaseoli]